MQRLALVWLAAPWLSAAVAALDISTNTINKASQDWASVDFPDINIGSGAYFLILDYENSFVKGSLKNKGGLYVSQTKTMGTVSFTVQGASFENEKDVVLSSFSTRQTSYYRLDVGKLVNSGSLYMGVTANYFDTPFQFIASGEFVNKGKIVLKAEGRDKVQASLQRRDWKPIQNDGALCMYNVQWEQGADLAGKGCIYVGKNSLFQLNGATYKTSSDLSIHLADATLILRLSSLFSTDVPTVTVYGFGNGNEILTYSTMNTWSYDSTNGILTITNWGSSMKFNIGRNYDSSKFNTIAQWGAIQGIKYTGSVPNSAPQSCSACLDAFPSTPTS